MHPAEHHEPNPEENITEGEAEIEQSVDAMMEPAPPADDAAHLLQQIADLKDQLLRTLADNDNLRKRAQRELEDANKYALNKFARDLVGVYENFFRAAAALPADVKESNDAVKNYAIGIEMTANEMTKVLERFGIRRLMPEIGEPFNHNHHQAVSQIPTADFAPGLVMMVMQAGYVLHDRLLQPAMVGVSTSLPSDIPHVDTKA